MKSRVLITGGSGLLGINWALSIKDRYEVISSYCSHKFTLPGIETVFFDADNISQYKKLISDISPDIIIHSAGLTSVEVCEEKKDLANKLNVVFSRDIAEICENKNIKLIHISTDHLYDGKLSYYEELTETSPLNIYGKTKLEAEKTVLVNNPEALIVRTNFYGWGTPYKHSFSDWIINNLRNNNAIKLFDDVFYTPIIIEVLANISMSLIESNKKGIVNIVGDERLSKYQFAEKITEVFNLDPGLLIRSSIEENTGLVKRPKDMSLSNKYLKNITGHDMGRVNEHLEILFAQENKGMPDIIKKAFD